MAYTKLNLDSDVPDMAPEFGLAPGLESHFARRALGLENGGLSLFRLQAGFRLPFGHVHSEQEEVYLVVGGAARVKLDDEVVELARWDAVRIAPGTWRGLEAGPEGAEVVAFGAPDTDNKDIEMQPGWWAG